MDKESTDIPVEVLRKINEHTSGGFILFFIDKKGDPSFAQHADNTTLLRGLVSYIEDTVDATREIEKLNRVSELHGDDEESIQGF